MSDSETTSADPLDRFLVVSISARPEVMPISNLAELAVERARTLDRLVDQQRRSLAIHRWRLRIVHGAATFFIGALMLLGGNRLLNQRQSMASTDESVSTTESTTPSTANYVLWLGGLLFICTVAGLATERAIASDRPSFVHVGS